MSTLGNVFGRTSKSYDSGKHIWHEVKGQYPVGGKIVNASEYAGKVIPAGSMCKYDSVNAEITIIKNADAAANKADIKGLLFHDVYVDADLEGAYATGAVVFAGEIYADRLEEAVPAEVWAVLPMIVPIHEV
jgi:hypothetical protein